MWCFPNKSCQLARNTPAGGFELVKHTPVTPVLDVNQNGHSEISGAIPNGQHHQKSDSANGDISLGGVTGVTGVTVFMFCLYK